MRPLTIQLNRSYNKIRSGPHGYKTLKSAALLVPLQSLHGHESHALREDFNLSFITVLVGVLSSLHRSMNIKFNENDRY